MAQRDKIVYEGQIHKSNTYALATTTKSLTLFSQSGASDSKMPH